MTFFQCRPRLPVPLPMYGIRKQSSSLFSSSLPSSSPCRQADPLKYSRSNPKWREKGKNFQALPSHLRLKTDRSAFCETNSLFGPKNIASGSKMRGEGSQVTIWGLLISTWTQLLPDQLPKLNQDPVDFQHWQLIPHQWRITTPWKATSQELWWIVNNFVLSLFLECASKGEPHQC